MLEHLYKKDLLLTGVDSGNTSNKISFLNNKGNIESLTIPTVIAPAPSAKVTDMDVKSTKESNQIAGESMLHVCITSKSLPKNQETGYFYVGEYAKDKKGRIEPEGEAQDKYNNTLHIVTTLTGLAVAAWRNGKSKVKVPYSGGLPIEEFKTVGAEKVLAQLQGTHIVKGIDGPYQGQEVTLLIEDGTVHVEGVTSSLALGFDIKKGEVIELPLGEEIGEDFALGDLGAGTLDLAVHNEYGFDKNKSTNKKIGTNKFIDEILEKLPNLNGFKEMRKMEEEEQTGSRPYDTREEFMREVVIPGVSEIIKGKKQKDINFIAEWGFETADCTELVVDAMTRYASEVEKELKRFWLNSKTKKFVVVGGGLLFGYIKFKDMERFIFPTNLKESAFFTSRAYLIANVIDELEKQPV